MDKIIKEFKKLAKDKEYLDKNQFRQLIVALQTMGMRDLKNDPFMDDLFDLFDEDKNGKLELKEFASGISMLCKGTPTEKVELTFNLWDENKGEKKNFAQNKKIYKKKY